MKGFTIIIVSFLATIVIMATTEMMNKTRDYQIECTKTGYILYDHSKVIGFIPASNGVLDSLIINDNQ
jgi:hypothetical protein